MAHSFLPFSLRKFIRREKSRLRREVLDPTEAEKKIREIVVKIHETYSRNGIRQ